MKKRKISQPLMLAIQKTKEAYDAFEKLDEDDKSVGGTPILLRQTFYTMHYV